MRPSVRLTLLAASVALLVAVFAPTAFAATTPSAAPAKWYAVDLTLILDENPAVLLVAGTLPTDTPLPATAQLLAPAGAQPQWLGEILGGDVNADPSLEASTTKRDEYDVYTFTLSQSRTAQLEALVSNATKPDGKDLKATLNWPAWEAADEVRLTLRLPKGAKITKSAEGAELFTTDPTANYYSRTFTNVKAGTKLSMSVSYNEPNFAGDLPSSGASRQTVFLLLGATLVAVLIVLAYALSRSKRPAAVEDETGTEADDGAESEAAEPEAAESAGEELPDLFE